MFVSVIIPTYNDKGRLKEAVGSLKKQTYPKDRYEIIIVDDGSDDGTKEWAQREIGNRSGNLKYFFQEHSGPARARNNGIKNALGEVIAFIDSDCVASPSWLEEIVKGYDKPGVAGIGGRIRASPTASKISQYCAYVRMNEQPVADKTGIVYIITGNASFKKANLDKVQGFDERYDFPGGEDPDLCYRIKRQGYVFQYNRNAVVYNRHKEKLRELFRSYFNYGKGEVFLILRRRSGWDLVSSRGPARVFSFLEAGGTMALKSLTYLNLMFNFLKVPFKALLYYAEGLSMREGLLFACLDYVKKFSFSQGYFFGYIPAKLKGFKCEGDGCVSDEHD
jgi:glycosyltransferase involved in cell wall biosynthesis